MPIYEYKCKRCGEVSEYIQKFSDPLMTGCKECGATGSLEKLMSLNSFHLKGSGWYLTDYARKDRQSAPKKSPAESNDNKQKSKKTTEKKDSGKS